MVMLVRRSPARHMYILRLEIVETVHNTPRGYYHIIFTLKGHVIMVLRKYSGGGDILQQEESGKMNAIFQQHIFQGSTIK